VVVAAADFAPLLCNALVPGYTCDYNTYMVAGSLEQIRKKAYELRNKAS
jgi:hypothetical protein